MRADRGCAAGIDRRLSATVPRAGPRAVDREAAAERLDAVGEAAQARPLGGIGAADPVVRDGHDRTAVLARDADVHLGRLRVLDHVRERLGDHVVGGRLDLARQLLGRRLELDRHGRAVGESLDGGCEPSIRQDSRVDPARELAELVEGSCKLLTGRLEHGHGLVGRGADLRLSEA